MERNELIQKATKIAKAVDEGNRLDYNERDGVIQIYVFAKDNDIWAKSIESTIEYGKDILLSLGYDFFKTGDITLKQLNEIVYGK